MQIGHVQIVGFPRSRWLRWFFLSGLVILILPGLVFAGIYLNHILQRQGVETNWNERSRPKIINFGNTRALRILPLVNWHTSGDKLFSEMGVSYLVQTDTHTILFDVGQNTRGEDPSPLLKNMQLLGIKLPDIDTIFISHSHFDHVGGKEWEQLRSFSLTAKQIDLKGKRVFTPVPLAYQNLTPVTISEPSVLFPGIASLGPIQRRLFIGLVEEQALIINLRDRGLVIFSGCGHQRLQRIVERTRETFGTRIFGIIGDLHYPVPSGRLQILGMNAQRVFASGEGPFETITQHDIERDIDLIKELKPGIVAIGGHDTSDEAIARFEREFGRAYRHIRVGEWINL